MSISALKKNRQAILDRLKKVSEEQNSGGGRRDYEDPRLWKPEFDKERGVGSAIIRFLPAKDPNNEPWARVYSYFFKGPTGKYYVENSLRTIGESDPCAALFSRLYNTGIDSDKELTERRRTRYYSWVYIIKDPANPENEGQVRLFEYGPFFHNMIQDAMFPKFEEDMPVNPFCPWDGADLNIRMVGKNLNGRTVPDYDSSKFLEPSTMGEDEFIDEVYSKVEDLGEFTAPDQFKSEDELKKRLIEVFGYQIGSGVQVVEGWGAPSKAQIQQSQPKQETIDQVAELTGSNAEDQSEDDGDDLEFLKSLVADL